MAARKFSERFTLEELQEETPRKIVESTLEEMGENGFGTITTKKISHRADMSTGIIHHYFDTKDNLVYAAYIKLVMDLYEYHRDITQQEPDPEKRLRAMIQVHFSSDHMDAEASNVWPQFWSHSLHDDRVHRLLYVYSKRSQSNLIAIFNQIFNDRDRAQRAAHQLFSTTHGVWLEHRVTGTITDPQYALGLVEQQLDYLLSDVTTQKSVTS